MIHRILLLASFIMLLLIRQTFATDESTQKHLFAQTIKGTYKLDKNRSSSTIEPSSIESSCDSEISPDINFESRDPQTIILAANLYIAVKDHVSTSAAGHTEGESDTHTLSVSPQNPANAIFNWYIPAESGSAEQTIRVKFSEDSEGKKIIFKKVQGRVNVRCVWVNNSSK